MRVLIDANIYLTYLLNPFGESAASQTVRLIGEGVFDLVFPSGTEVEIRRLATTKSYLRERIDPSQVDELVALLRVQAVTYELSELFRGRIRDSDDRYLLDAALSADVDFLVTGDRDLLVLRDEIGRPLIVTAAEFLAIREAGYN